jgi:FMN phosphatase YigB (HAD superfamily)
LITTGIDYGRAVFRWGLMFLDMMEHRAPHYNDFTPPFLKALRDFETERFQKMRAHRERFPGSMVLAYRAVCQQLEIDVDPEIERKTWDIGMSYMSEEAYRTREMIPGAKTTLKFLREQGDLLYCVTAGDAVVQWMKYRGYNLRRFFPSQRKYRVVKWDKFSTLRRLRKLHRDKPIIMVGDSIGSDLIPAVKAGYLPIYIPHPSVWDHGQLVKGAPEGTIQLRKIFQIVEKYESLIKPTG